jgi:hypothetical protein
VRDVQNVVDRVDREADGLVGHEADDHDSQALGDRRGEPELERGVMIR